MHLRPETFLDGVFLYSSTLNVRARTCQECFGHFFICKSCDRGHRYCSITCRDHGYKRRESAAKKRYSQSKLGRQNHAARQKRYRSKNKNPSKNKVTEESSKILHSEVLLPVTTFTCTPGFYQGPRCCICQRPVKASYLEKIYEDSS